MNPPAPGAPPQPSLDPKISFPVLHTGQVSSFRWRGARQSGPFITLIESVCADIAALMRRALLARVFPDKAVVISGAIPLDPNVSSLSQAPTTWQLHAIRLQSLRQQIAFRLSSDEP